MRGNQRLEPETIRAYANLAPGQTYTAETLDQALKDLYATQLFADVTITGAETGDLVITVRENPVINRIILEGNKRLKDDKITPGDQARAAADLHAHRGARRTSTASSSFIAGRAASPRGSNPRSSSSTRTASTSSSRSTKATSPRFARSTSSATRNSATDRLRKEMYTRQAGGVSRLPQVERHLRSGSACGRPAEAPRLLPDPGLCRFPRCLGSCRTDARSPRLRHHLRGRGRPALQVRQRSKPTSALPDLPPETVHQAGRQAAAGRLVQRQAGRGRGHQPQRGGRQSRLRVRRHQSVLRSRRRKARDEPDDQGRATRRAFMSSVSTSPATRRRATRSSGANSASTRATPSMRCKVKRSQDRHPEPRLLPGEAGDQADRRLGSGPRRSRRERRGEADGPAVAVRRLFEP